jgi:hypothetical protein
MALQIQGNSGVVADVAGTGFRAIKNQAMPYEYGALGHYRTSVSISSTAVQAVNSRIFEVRNAGSNLLVLTMLRVKASQAAAGTAQLMTLAAFKLTSFTAVDTTNTVTPVSSVMRTSGMAAYPGGAAVRHLTLAGAAAGMTGGTMTKDTQAFGHMLLPVNAAAQSNMLETEMATPNGVTGGHPLVFANNEGWEVENLVVNATSYGYTWIIDCAWAEVTAF